MGRPPQVLASRERGDAGVQASGRGVEGGGELDGKVRIALSVPQGPVSLGDILGGHPEDSLKLLAPPSRPSCLWSQRRPILDPGYNLVFHATSLHHLETINTEEIVPTGSLG